MASDETLQVVRAASALTPHPPHPLCCAHPRPPAGPPHANTSRSVRAVQISHGQHRRISSAHDTPVCTKITNSEEANGRFGIDQINKCEHHCRLSPEQDGAGFHHSSPRVSRLVRKVQLSSHRSLQSLNEVVDLSPLTERTRSVRSSGNTSITPSQVPNLSNLSGADSNSMDDSVTGEPRSHNKQHKSTCGASFLSTVEQTDEDKVKGTAEYFHWLVLSESESPPSQNDSGMSNSGTDSGHLRRCSDQQQCLTDFSHHLESNSKQRKSKSSPSAAVKANTQLFFSSKRPLEGITAQPKSVQETQTRMEMINTFYQPVPPARVPT